MRWPTIAVALSLLLSLAWAQDNILRNPSFEEAVDGKPVAWSTRAGEPFELMTDGGRTGNNYVRIEDTKNNAGVALQPTLIPARPGGLYRASVWVRTEDKVQPGLYINFFDDVGTRIHHLFKRATGPTDGWVKIEAQLVCPTDATDVGAFIYSYVGDVGTIDADDVMMTVEGGGEPGSGGVTRVETGEKTMVDIGSRLELFVDEFMVDGLSDGAERRLHQPVPREVVLTFDKPWEGPYCGYVSVMNVDGKVRLYYRGWPELGKGDCACVVESDDGIHFTRPNLGLHEWDGSTENNIVWKGPGCHNFTPFLDENPNAPADQKFKALAGGPLLAFVSPDGYNWKLLQDEPVITKGAFDSQNLAFFDTVRGDYVEYHRGFKDGVRDIMTSRSADFVNWPEPDWLSYGDAPREHLYTNAIVPYFRAPHIYIGFPCRFVPSRKKVASHKEVGVNDGVLMSSRDGLTFDRWVEAFLRPGPDTLRWTDRNNYLAWGMAATSDEEISVYWSEHYRYPQYRLRRGTLRTDGFVSIHAGARGGEVLTRPFTFEGSRLVVNYDTSAIGVARFELCDENGEAYPGFTMGESETLFGSEIAHVVKWGENTDVSSLAGKPVRLRVRLKDADLYSFQFGE